MAIIGIDLGTTNSLVSIWRHGRAELIPNSLGTFLTPSVVSMDKDGTLWLSLIHIWVRLRPMHMWISRRLSGRQYGGLDMTVQNTDLTAIPAA